MSEKQEIRIEVQGRLVSFVTGQFAAWCGHKADKSRAKSWEEAKEWLKDYRGLLAGDRKPTEVGTPLLSIFSRVKDPKSEAKVPQCYWPPGELDLDSIPIPKENLKLELADLKALWENFDEEATRVLDLPIDAEARFEAFTHLLHKHAWAVPCSYGEPGVSLYDEFRALSALVHASGCTEEPAGEFLLVGGDIPGIQKTIYTITSKGAAKGLRGRSFFIQLLGDAVVRRLLAELGLPETNVVYAAGGNFVLLAPLRVENGDREAEQILRQALCQVNARLVEAIQGDTALVLASVAVKKSELFAPESFREKREALGEKVAQAKNQPLRELADDWATLFKPKGKGSDQSCAVCRVEVDQHNSKPLEPTGESPEPGAARICHLCASFGELARAIRRDELWLAVEDAPEKLGTKVQPKDGWAELLERMTSYRYSFHGGPPDVKGTVLLVNEPNFVSNGTYGLRLAATVTPTTTRADIRYLRETAKWDEKDLPKEGEIRSFTLLAHAARKAGAIERVGVLRMDVDNLGQIFSQGVDGLTLPTLGALSGALDLFFSGYLNELVQKQAANDLYIIYAGGDDLFIVGAWHHLPDLAETIREHFKAFIGGHPDLSLSGGLILEGARFPLYRAAERAGEAEGKAKGYTRSDGHEKDAFCFLDTVVGWEEWASVVRSQKDELLWLVGEDKENRTKQKDEQERRLPRALLHIVQSIHQLYHTDWQKACRQARQEKKELPDPHLFYGRWMWMKVYSLTRLAERRKSKDIFARVKKLQNEFIKPATVRYSGLAARWAEYLTRREEG